MESLRRWLGRLTSVIGLIGIVLSVATVVMTWRAAIAFSEQVVQVGDRIVEVKDNADTYVLQVETTLASMHENVSSLRQACDEVSTGENQNRILVPRLQELDNEISQTLSTARSLMESLQSGADMLMQAISLYDSLAAPMRFLSRSSEPARNTDLEALSSSLSASSGRIQQMIDLIARMEQRSITAQEARELSVAAAGLEQELVRSRARLTSFRDFLDVAGKQVVTRRDKAPFWARAVATFLTVFLVCFGFTQIQLVAFGQRVARGREKKVRR